MDEEEDREQEEEQVAFNERLVAETQWLLGLPEQKRTEYIRGVINGLAQSIQQIAEHQGGIMEKLNLVSQLVEELDENAPRMIPPITYAIKPEFQDVFSDFLRHLMLLT